jgi:hypothetical protein
MDHFYPIALPSASATDSLRVTQCYSVKTGRVTTIVHKSSPAQTPTLAAAAAGAAAAAAAAAAEKEPFVIAF